MNKVILMGRLTKDPEIRYTTSNNTPVCRFSIAVDRPYVKQGEERQADFFNIVAWRGRAEFAGKFFKKGMRVLVEGWIRNNVWDDNQGVRHYSDEIQADNMYFADGKRDDYSSGYSQPYPQNQRPQQQPPESVQAETGDGFYALNEDDDELPF